MKSIKCPQCGLTNWETAEWCKRCKYILKSNSFESAATTENATFRNSASAGSENHQAHNSYGENSRQKTGAGSARQPYGRAAYHRESNFVAKNVERCNRNVMIVCILVVTAVIAGFFLNARYFYNVIAGPAKLSHDEVLFGKNLPGAFRNYVTINADEIYDTGGKYVVVRNHSSETVESRYVALAVGEKLIVAEVEPGSPYTDGAKNIEISGELVEMPPSVSDKIIAPILRQQPELRTDLMPFMLKGKSGFATFAYAGAAIGLILLLIAGFSLKSVLKIMGTPENSPLFAFLGNYGAPLEIAASIDSEVNGDHEKIGPVYLLPNWIVKKGTFRMEIQHVEEIVWVYKKVTKHSVNFIPTGKTHEVILHNTKGDTLSLSGSFMNERKTDAIMQAIYQRVPWVIFGYDDELTSYWSKNRDGFIVTVKERKKSYHEAPKTEPVNA